MQGGLASGWASHAMVLVVAALARPFAQAQVSLGSLELASSSCCVARSGLLMGLISSGGVVGELPGGVGGVLGGGRGVIVVLGVIGVIGVLGVIGN